MWNTCNILLVTRIKNQMERVGFVQLRTIISFLHIAVISASKSFGLETDPRTEYFFLFMP